jgi:hypothetical protein
MSISEQKTEELSVEQVSKEEERINIDPITAFNLKLKEFDKKIADAEWQVITLKKERATYIYDQQVQQIIMAHRESVIRAQAEEEARKKFAGQ